MLLLKAYIVWWCPKTDKYEAWVKKQYLSTSICIEFLNFQIGSTFVFQYFQFLKFSGKQYGIWGQQLSTVWSPAERLKVTNTNTNTSRMFKSDENKYIQKWQNMDYQYWKDWKCWWAIWIQIQMLEPAKLQLMLSRLCGPMTLFFQKWFNKQCKSDKSFLKIRDMFSCLKNPNNSFDSCSIWIFVQILGEGCYNVIFLHLHEEAFQRKGTKETRKHEQYQTHQTYFFKYKCPIQQPKWRYW